MTNVASGAIATLAHMYTWHERGLLGIPRCEQCNNSDLDAPVQPSLSESLKRNHG